MKCLVFKIGHDEHNINHITSLSYDDVDIISKIHNCNVDSNYFNADNKYLSEYSVIKEILHNIDKEIPKNYTHVGIITYRTFFGTDYDEEIEYHNKLIKLAKLIHNNLQEYEGIISTDLKLNDLPNYIIRSRWTGSLSMDIISEALTDDSALHAAWDEYQMGYHNSYRTICILPRDEFLYLFNLVCSYSDEFMKLRKDHNELLPRSVGYELETFTSFLLIESSKIHNYSRIKNSVIL